MDREALGRLFLRELEKIIDRRAGRPAGVVDACFRLLGIVISEATRRERIQFTTFFSRIAYVSQKAGLSRRLQFFVHTFRREALAADLGARLDDDRAYLPDLGLKVVAELIYRLFGATPSATLAEKLPADWPLEFQPQEAVDFRPGVRVVALDDEPPARRMLIKDEERPDAEAYLHYDLPDHNENFNPTIELIREVFGLPVNLMLIDVEIASGGVYRPRAIVVEPDFLVDVSAVAECFQATGAIPELYLLKKYLPFRTSTPLLLGNIANFFLDELMHREDAVFQEVFPRVFRLHPLAFCQVSNRELRELMQKSQRHFVHLQDAIRCDFPAEQIHKADCYLEPTFYSEVYGLQGRLDVLAKNPAKTAIVELKSGKTYRTNINGINANHFTQTLLYDLIVRSTFGRRSDPANYILYSHEAERRLRYAPVVKSQQYEALQVRNQILGMEQRLAGVGANRVLGLDRLEGAATAIFRNLTPQAAPAAGGFIRRDLQFFAEVFGGMSDLMRRYFAAFSGFVAREQKYAKTGWREDDGDFGQAALWRSSFAEKQDRFALLSHLSLESQNVTDAEPTITFRRTARTNPLANFRRGDIAVLYPWADADRSPLRNQLFKCSILEMDQEKVIVRLRSNQFNDQLFREHELWNLEHDLLDSSFTGMYRNLFAFARAPERARQLLLGLEPPAAPAPEAVDTPPELTPEQAGIFQQMLQSRDYFLLWGPPGTGKTSIMLKYLVGYLFDQTREEILLLAYTNRAVDEICEAIEAYRPEMHQAYLRIGSRYATDPRFADRLLDVNVDRISNRQELMALLAGHRIFVGTVASVSSKPELLELKAFNRVIIDEASQILEPMLVGLLPYFAHFTLIGDHKQLPAVVVQDERLSEVDDEALRSIGLNNLRNSLFERLFKQCQLREWDWAFAQLSHQGRMHRDIMAFPNRHFYDGGLKILPASVPHHQRQLDAGALQCGPEATDLQRLLISERVLFFGVAPDADDIAGKTSNAEALAIGRLVRELMDLYRQNGRPFRPKTLGVITPFRAQIARIRNVLQEMGMDPDRITIDTVERYQGGARDIILISLCANSIGQLRSLVSLSEEGVDRKLNVALTRAREHLIMVGNPEYLNTDPIYRQLIADYYQSWEEVVR